MPSWQSSLVSQSQPEGGSHLPLGNFGWIPSSRDFGFLGGSSRVRDSGLSVGSAQCAVCVCPMGYSLILSSTHILPASEHRNCARLCALRDTPLCPFAFFGRRGDNFFLPTSELPIPLSSISSEWKVFRAAQGAALFGFSLPPHPRRLSPNSRESARQVGMSRRFT